MYIDHKLPQMAPEAPRLVHLSLASQESIVSSLAKTATTVEQLRRFTTGILKRSLSQSEPRLYLKRAVTRTCEAFADAVDRTVRGLDSWCAAREEAICRAYSGVDEEPLVISLLSTEKAIRDEFESSLEVLLEVVRTVFKLQSSNDLTSFDRGSARQPPATLTALLLDTLFIGVQQHMERRDTVTSDALMRVFVQTAEPVWGMVGKWLRDGMGLGLSVGSGGNFGMASEFDDEFFIESSVVGVGMIALGLPDPEFWNGGYALREDVAPMGDSVSRFSPRRKAIPLFLEHVAELVLSTGKALGLIRALGGPPLAHGFNNWRTFADLVSLETHDSDGVKQKNAGLFSVSIDTLSRLIYDGLLAHCQVTGAVLVKLLVDDCQLLWHMEAIEGFFLMRKGDAMSQFIDILFTKVSIPLLFAWSQFHLCCIRWIISNNLGPIFTFSTLYSMMLSKPT
jgi:gamma-tubulin complex component 5